MRISEAQALAKTLAEKFDRKHRKMKRKSTAQLYFLDMIETLGELAGTVRLRNSGVRPQSSIE